MYRSLDLLVRTRTSLVFVNIFIIPISSLLAHVTALISVINAFPAKNTNSFPGFVLKYAPLSYLHSDEQHWPSDVAAHLLIPEVNFAAVGGPPALKTLGTLANNVYLTAVDDVLAHSSAFFTSIVGKPASNFSAAPATIIVVEKPGG